MFWRAGLSAGSSLSFLKNHYLLKGCRIVKPHPSGDVPQLGIGIKIGIGIGIGFENAVRVAMPIPIANDEFTLIMFVVQPLGC